MVQQLKRKSPVSLVILCALLIGGLISASQSVTSTGAEEKLQTVEPSGPTAAINLPEGSKPQAMAIGDLNGDGLIDLAVAASKSDDVFVLLNKGLGIFDLTASLPVGTKPKSIAIGDFNGDALLDLAVANSKSNDVSILLNDGLGGFEALTRLPVGTKPKSVALGDVNMDGLLDLVVANSKSDDVSILLNDGLGGFEAAVSVPAGAKPTAIAIGDLNDDGIADLAVANTRSDEITILLNDGTGGFEVTMRLQVGSRPKAIALGDLNNDDLTDLVVANSKSDDISILFNDGLGGFEPEVRFPVGTKPKAVVVGDLNNDAWLDIVVANAKGDTISILLNDPLGTFAPAIEVAVGSKPKSLVLGDLNGDGEIDLAVVNARSRDISILLNDGTGRLILTEEQQGSVVLERIGNQTVPLGSSLTLNLTATGSADNPFTFSASPLPLPANASINAITGVFSFKPAEDQVGDIELRFIVSDGRSTDSETVTITVQGPLPGGETALTGRLLDTTDFVQGIETPVVGATISLINSGLMTTSNANGDFVLRGISGTTHLFDINGATAVLGPGGATYASFREEIELIAGVTNVIDRPFFLPRIDASSLTTVDPATTTVVTNPNIGTSLAVPANTAMNADGSAFTGQLSISEVPEGLAPMELPAGLNPGMLVTIQPVGVTFDTPVPITFPNIDELPAGSETDIWSFDPETGNFVIVGTGRVSADGTVIETISGGIRAATWHAALPPGGNSDGSSNNPDNQDQSKTCKLRGGSLTAACSGNLTVQHALASYRSLSQSRAPRLIYNSIHADPQPTISSDVTISMRAAVPPTVSTRLNVAGVDQGFEVFTDTSGLNENVDEIIRQIVQFDASAFPTGRYPYQLTLSSNYRRSSVSSVQRGNVLVNNQQNSPFGSGWTLEGLGQLKIQPNRSALVTEGDGSAKLFLLAPSSENGLQIQLFDTPDPVTAVDTGFAGLTPGEFIVTTANETTTAISFTIPIVDFPDTGFDIAAFYNVGANGVIDSGSTALEPVGDDISIQATGGNDTFGASITGFLFLPDGGDVTFTIGIDDAFDLIVNGQSVLRFIGITDFRNFTQTVLGLPSGFVPITLNFGENFGEANIVLSAIGGGLPGGLIPQEFLFTAIPMDTDEPRVFRPPPGDFSLLIRNDDGTFTRTLKDATQINFNAAGLHASTVDRNGNATTYTYDAEDRLITITDPKGLVTTLTYTGGLLASITGPAGHTTTFEHDTDGNLIRITDPDNSARQFAYDARHRMISQTSKNGSTTTYDYNFAGRHIQANRPDGSTRRIVPSQTIGLVDLSTSLGTQSNPAPVVRPEAATAAFTDGNGNTMSFTTDRFGAATVTTDALGRQTTITRNDDSNPTQVTRPNSAVTTMTYDAKGNLLTSTEDSIGTTTTFTYEPTFNQVTSIIDPNGSPTTINYDANGNPIEVIDALGTTTMLEYTDPSCPGQITGIVAAAGLPDESTTLFEYDLATCNLVRTVDPLGNATILAYNTAGNVIQSTDAKGRVTRFQYDAMNRLTKTIDAMNTDPDPPCDTAGVTCLAYDANGNNTTVTDARGSQTTFEYDAIDRLIRRVDPLGNAESFNYDGNGNLLSILDRKGQTIGFQYDAANQLIQKILLPGQPSEAVTTFAYDAVGNLTAVIDPDSALTMTYDLLSRLERVSTSGTTSSTVLDVNIDGIINAGPIAEFSNRAVSTGLLPPGDYQISITSGAIALCSRNCNLTAISFRLGENEPIFDLGVLEDIPASLQPPERYWDGVQRTVTGAFDAYLLSDTSLQNVTLQTPAELFFYLIDNLSGDFRHDNSGSLTVRIESMAPSDNGITHNQPDTSVEYTYDKNGNRLTMTDPTAQTTYEYDALNRLTSMTNPSNQTVTFDYDALSRRTQTTFPNGTTANHTYDAASQLLSLVHQLGGNPTPISAFSYTYDAVGNRTSMGQQRSAVAVNSPLVYVYDVLDRLVQATRPLPADPLETFQYDAVGNRLLRDGRATSAMFDAANRLLEDDDFCYSYDLNGNLTTKEIKVGGVCNEIGELTEYEYDPENQLIEVRVNGAVVGSYRYDGLGRRIEKAAGATITRYVYDNEDILLELDGANTNLVRYTHGPGIDEPLVMERGGESFFYHADGLGSITELSDSTGTVAQAYVYDSFGNIMQKAGLIPNPYTYTGREFDTETGLYYYRARYYEPKSGRFLQEDPIGLLGGLNLYSYVRNNPVNAVDPMGLLPRSPGNIVCKLECKVVCNPFNCFIGKRICTKVCNEVCEDPLDCNIIFVRKGDKCFSCQQCLGQPDPICEQVPASQCGLPTLP